MDAARLEAKRWRKANNKDLYCLWCGKEIGEWSDCQCHASHWRPARQMTAADLGLEVCDA